MDMVDNIFNKFEVPVLAGKNDNILSFNMFTF